MGRRERPQTCEPAPLQQSAPVTVLVQLPAPASNSERTSIPKGPCSGLRPIPRATSKKRLVELTHSASSQLSTCQSIPARCLPQLGMACTKPSSQPIHMCGQPPSYCCLATSIRGQQCNQMIQCVLVAYRYATAGPAPQSVGGGEPWESASICQVVRVPVCS